MDHIPQELLFLSIKGINLLHTSAVDPSAVDGSAAVGPAARLVVSVDHLQLDSQLWATPYPSIFYPLRRGSGLDGPENEGRNLQDGAFVCLCLEYDVQQGIVLVPLLRLQVLPFDINIEGTIISRLSNLLTVATGFASDDGALVDEGQWDLRATLAGPGGAASAADLQPQPHEVSSALHVMARQSWEGSSKSGRRRAESITLETAVSGGGRGGDSGGGSAGPKPLSLVRELVIILLLDLSEPLLATPPPQPKVFIETLDFSDVRFNLSLNLDVMKGHDNILERHVFTHTQSVWLNAIKTVLLAAVSTISKIDNCQFSFSAYRNSDVFCSQEELVARLQHHYAMQLAVATLQLLGSFDFMGNPTELLRTLGEGLTDFLVLPVIGLMAYDPAAFGQGLIMGTSSLIRRTLASLLTSLCHFSVSLQIGLSALGVVDPFLGMSSDGTSILLAPGTYRGLSRGSNIYAGRPVGTIDGFMIALQDLLASPYVGINTGGLKGLLVGICHGLLGLGAKPLYGLLTDASRRMDHLSFRLLPRVLGEHKYRLRRARPPRFFAPGAATQPLSVYSEDENIGSELLSRAAYGQYRAEGYVWYAALQDQCIVIITTARVIVVGESNGFCELLWQCPLRALLFLEIDETQDQPPVSTGESPPSTPFGAAYTMTSPPMLFMPRRGLAGMLGDSNAYLGPSLRLLEDSRHPSKPSLLHSQSHDRAGPWEGGVEPRGSPLRAGAHRWAGAVAGATGVVGGGGAAADSGGARTADVGRARSNSAPGSLTPVLPWSPSGVSPTIPPRPSRPAPIPQRPTLLQPARHAPVLRLFFLPTPGWGGRPRGMAINEWSLHLLTQESLFFFLVRLLYLMPVLAGEDVLEVRGFGPLISIRACSCIPV